MKIFLLFLVLTNVLDFEKFINEFSENDYTFVNKFHKIPNNLKSHLKEFRKIKFVKNSNYNLSDFNNKIHQRGYLYFYYSSTIAILHYSHGGKGSHYHTYIIKSDGKSEEWYKNLITPKHKNLKELIEILRNKNFSEQVYDEL
ncbi:hypothetical protein [Emticicia sp. C21]|uniref:hypothetical protein n=1 Tax=Emticicia sp. C21 TaxID=2302915 RepID=UPI000E351A05|nr:hypothetical protein [Emticicia sp. C21]RFS16051.1 hypothetical protein D0T08_14265 [Emticicia sp. C21]